MDNIIDKLFQEIEYQKNEFNNELTYYSNNDWAYYFTLHINDTEFKKIKSFSDFEQIEEYKKFKTSFDLLEQQGESNKVEKNSSLIILLKCDSLVVLEEYQQQILLLEEDEYFLKKYVVIYTEKSIVELKNTEEILPQLKEKVNDKDKFETYAKNGFNNNLEEYLLVLQLYIKLPFLTLSFDGDAFQTLPSKISDVLEESQEHVYNILTEKAEDFLKIDFQAENYEEKIGEIIKLLEND
jgi:hypothetical protein